jgi:Uma2 family endonuclease
MTSTHLVTADELLAMGSDAPYELWEGTLKEVSPSSAWPGVVGARLLSAILYHVEAQSLGYVTNADAGFVLNSNPYTVVAPDIGFFRGDRFPGGVPRRGYFPMPPDLAVEVISQTDERADMQRKQDLYTRAGVPQVWWVDPEERTVTVHRPGQPPEVLDDSATLDGEDVLPGFTLPVERIFAIKHPPQWD